MIEKERLIMLVWNSSWLITTFYWQQQWIIADNFKANESTQRWSCQYYSIKFREKLVAFWDIILSKFKPIPQLPPPCQVQCLMGVWHHTFHHREEDSILRSALRDGTALDNRVSWSATLFAEKFWPATAYYRIGNCINPKNIY